MASTTRKPSAGTSQALLRDVRVAANAGDVWFVSVAHSLNRIGTWAQCEVDGAADSTVAAFAATFDATKKLTAKTVRITLDVSKKLSGETCQPARMSRRDAGRAGPESAAEKAAVRNGPRGSFDLVSATPEGSEGSLSSAPHDLELCGAEAGSELHATGNPPGVLPLVQALGCVVADHTDGRYTTLAGDGRLWTLIELLQALAPAQITPVAPEELGHEDEEGPVGKALRRAEAHANPESSTGEGKE